MRQKPSKCLPTSSYFPRRKKIKNKKSREPKTKIRTMEHVTFIIFVGFPIENKKQINGNK